AVLLTPFTHFTQTHHYLCLALDLLGVVDLTHLQLHLQLHEIFLDRSVISQLLAHDTIDLVERPFRSPDWAEERSEQNVGEKSHVISRRRSGRLLQLQLDVDEVIWRPRSRVLECEQI